MSLNLGEAEGCVEVDTHRPALRLLCIAKTFRDNVETCSEAAVGSLNHENIPEKYVFALI